MAGMKLKALEQYLQEVKVFTHPKVQLEQYSTMPHIASRVLHVIQSSFGDIDGRLVADLGCGCGTLTIGAALLDAALCIGFDIDHDALSVFSANVEQFELNNIEAVQCDVLHGVAERWNKKFNTVVMNPPFGTKKNHGIDKEFLQVALRLADTAVYSLHKSSTRKYVLQKAKDWGVKAQVLAELHFDLPASYKFHRKQSVDIEVDLLQFTFHK